MPRRSKYWCWTSFKLDDNGALALPNTDVERMTYMIFGFEECPTTGRKHLQGYVEYSDKVVLSTSQRRLGLGSIRHDARNGTAIQASDYCKKDDNFVEHGELSPPEQGKRNDLLIFKKAVMDGEFTTWRDIMMDDRFINVIANKRTWAREIWDIYQADNVPTKRNICTTVYWGATGTGKTHKVMTENQNVFSWNANAMRGSWTGYDGQKTLLIDEFYGQVKVSDMLKILDGWKNQVHVNYSYTYLNFDKIFITSNKHPEDWYSGWENIPVEVKKAFFDRLGEITEFTGESRRTGSG